MSTGLNGGCGLPVMAIRVVVVHTPFSCHGTLHLREQSEVVSFYLSRTLTLQLYRVAIDISKCDIPRPCVLRMGVASPAASSSWY